MFKFVCKHIPAPSDYPQLDSKVPQKKDNKILIEGGWRVEVHLYTYVYMCMLRTRGREAPSKNRTPGVQGRLCPNTSHVHNIYIYIYIHIVIYLFIYI